MAMLGKRRPARTSPRQSIDRPRDAPGSDDGVRILRLAHDGRGVARDGSGKTLFVDRALPGERLRVAVHRSRKRFDEAHASEWLETSPERVTPPCVHYAQCGGCDLQHLVLDAQRRHKRDVLIDQLTRQGLSLDAPPALIAGSALGYRRRARLGVKVDANGQVHLGFRARGSHHLVDVDQCPILEPALAALLAPLRQRLEALSAPRLVGHIELLNSDTGAAVVIRQLRANPDDARAWQAWAEECGVGLALREGRENPRLRWLGKVPALRYTLWSGEKRLALEFAPGDFLQVNAEINQALVSTALDWLQPSPDAQVLDLYAGVGNFSLALAAQVARVTAMEGSQAMVERLLANARHNGLPNVDARQADLANPPDIASAHDLVVLDPPRDGAESTCRALAGSGVPRVLYISCDAATLARDATHLRNAGYQVTRAAVADMFVQTTHLESMLLFERGVAR